MDYQRIHPLISELIIAATNFTSRCPQRQESAISPRIRCRACHINCSAGDRMLRTRRPDFRRPTDDGQSGSSPGLLHQSSFVRQSCYCSQQPVTGPISASDSADLASLYRLEAHSFYRAAVSDQYQWTSPWLTGFAQI